MPVSPVDKIMSSAANLAPEFQKVFQGAVQAERKPIQLMNEKKEKMESKVGLLNDVIGKVDSIKKMLPNLGTATGLLEISLTTNDDKVVSGVAEKGLAPLGDFNIEVVQLATPASAVSNGFPDKSETRAGTGFLTIEVGNGETKEVFIDDENATLEGIANSVNKADVGVRASVIRDASDPENPFRLMLTGKESGTGATVAYPDFYFIDGESELYIDREQAASNAVVRFEGQEFESASNELKDVIPGVTLNLRGVSDGRPVTVHVEQDTPKTSAKIKELVTHLNEVFTFVQKQNALDQNSDTSKTLGGDYSLKVTDSRLKAALFQNLPSDLARRIRSLGDMGIQFNRGGTLDFDEEKLKAALKANFEQVTDVLLGPDNLSGVLPRISNALTSISSPGVGVLSNQKKTYTDAMQKLDREIEKKEAMVEHKAELLKNKLARTQGALAALKEQGARLSQALPTPGSPF